MESDEQRRRIGVQESESLFFSPSFNSYSSDRFAQIAAKVTEEYQLAADEASTDDDDDDFEFALVRSDFDVTSDEVFGDGQFRPVFPIFNRDLLGRDDSVPEVSKSLRLPLKKLFVEERDPPSSEEEEADELDGITPETYCVWRPKAVEASRCKKSSSTGSASKRWKLRDYLFRSNSEGKDAFVFLTPKSGEQNGAKTGGVEDSNERRSSRDGALEPKPNAKAKVNGVVVGGGGKVASPSAHEVLYVRNRASREGDKRKSFLPYRPGLVGFFANVNGVGRTFPSF